MSPERVHSSEARHLATADASPCRTTVMWHRDHATLHNRVVGAASLGPQLVCRVVAAPLPESRASCVDICLFGLSRRRWCGSCWRPPFPSETAVLIDHCVRVVLGAHGPDVQSVDAVTTIFARCLHGSLAWVVDVTRKLPQGIRVPTPREDAAASLASRSGLDTSRQLAGGHAAVGFFGTTNSTW